MSLFRRCFLTCSLLLAIPAARAQLAVYGAVAATDFGFIETTNANPSFESDSAGFIGGVFYNFPIDSRVTVGLDARASYSPGTRGGESFGAALRVGFVPKTNPLRPYFQLGAGFVTAPEQEYTIIVNGFSETTVPYSKRRTSGAAELAFGLDVRLTDSVDLRAIEFGAEAGASSANAVGISFVDIGIVYHLHPKKK